MAATTFVHKGRSIDHTPVGPISAGDVVVQGELVGVAKLDIATGKLGALAVEGVFDFPKAIGSAAAIAIGAKVYWLDATDVATTDATAPNKLIGKCIRAATADDTTVRIRMSQ